MRCSGSCNFVLQRLDLIMKIIFNISRILLGLNFIIFGINGLYPFIPVPEFHPFMQMMVDSGLIVVVKVIEIVGGILLLTNRFTLVGLLLLGPVVFNILLYHLLLDPRNMLVGFINLILYIILVHGFWPYFQKLLVLKPKAKV